MPYQNPEARRAYYAANRDKMTAQMRAYRTANKDRVNAQVRARRAADPEHARAVAAAWRQANAAKVAEQNRIRNARRNRGKDRIAHLRRLHGMQPEEWDALWQAQDGRCYLCGCELMIGVQNGHAALAVIDHDHTCCAPPHSCSYCRRGMACGSCNTLIGYANDDPARLRRVADNLEAAIAATTARIALKPAPATLWP